MRHRRRRRTGRRYGYRLSAVRTRPRGVFPHPRTPKLTVESSLSSNDKAVEMAMEKSELGIRDGRI
ncbi:unnamed protein product, partial [Nesidiocoris tenuis]